MRNRKNREKGNRGPIYPVVILAGCLLYGCCFFLVFAVAEGTWTRLAAGFLGVSAITLLPVFYGFCQRQVKTASLSCREQVWQGLWFSFASLGAAVLFSCPIIYLLPWYGVGTMETILIGYFLALLLLFHGALWYYFFVITR